MRKFIEKMKNKTNDQKKFFAFLMASLLTFFIFTFWLFNFIFLNKNTNLAIIKNEKFSEIKNEANTISPMFNDLKKLLKNEN